jgi:hypothetical protein
MTDRTALLRHRARADRDPVLFLHEEAAREIEERLAEVNKAFTAPALVGHVTAPFRAILPDAPIIPDSDRLEFAASHDLIVHTFGLHWADDPVGQLVQSRLALVPDGLFLAVLFGGQTLHELRASLAEAETRLTGGLSPRVLPMADVRETGALLQRSGLALPVADSVRLTVRYRDLAGLMRDLRGMGETNALAARHRRVPPKDLFALAECLYSKAFTDPEGYLPATFELVFLTGWAPSDTQPTPLRPGSAKARLADALNTRETPLDD